MDFPGQPGALGQHAGVVLGAGEFGTGAAQLLGRQPLVFRLQEQRPVGQAGDHSEGCAENGPEHHGQLQPTLAGSAVARSGDALPPLWNQSAAITNAVLSAIAGSASRRRSTCSCRKNSGKASQTKSALAQTSSSHRRQTTPSHQAE